jgi:hypothetical protein
MVLQMDLIELTVLDGIPKTKHATTVDIAFALVSCPPDLVEVTKNKPPHPLRGFEGNELGEELVF